MAPPSRKTVVCPVSALAFFPSPRTGRLYLLAGEDSSLLVFDVSTGALVRSATAVLRTQPVHGIFCAEGAEGADGGRGVVLVWGNTAVARVDVGRLIGEGEGEGEGQDDGGSLEVHAPDWIYDAQLSPWDDTLGLAVTAHNEAVAFRCPRGGRGIEFGAVASPSRPMLYAASLHWLSASSALIAAGTVFGEIHVWRCDVGAHGEVGARMRCVLTGHEGSIFGLSLHQTRTDGDRKGEGMLLASCSDDRTIRVWDVSEDHGAADQERTWTDDALKAPRETGFCSAGGDKNQEEGKDVDDAQRRQVAVAMGHVSRIWGVRFLDDRTLCSFGEDCAVQTWGLALSPSGEQEARLVRGATRTAHEGKHIWASCVRSLDDGTALVATGGADGRVVLANTGGESPIVLAMDDIFGESIVPDKDHGLEGNKGNNNKDKNKNKFRQFEFVSPDALLLATTAGQLLHGVIARDGAAEKVAWTECPLRESVAAAALGTSTVMRRIAAGVAVVGTSKGHVYIASRGRVELVAQVGRSVLDVLPLESGFWGEDGISDGVDSHVPVLVSLGAASPVLLSLDLADYCATAQETMTALDPRFIATSAAFVGTHLVIGSRHGFLALLAHARSPSSGQYQWTLLGDARHSDDAITAIVALSPTRFLTTSRDGKLRIHSLSESPAAPLSVLHEETPPLGPNLDAAWRDPASGHVVISGFRDGAIVVQDMTAREDLAVVDCGGPHRTFTMMRGVLKGDYEEHCKGVRIAFNRAGKVHIHTRPTAPQRILRPGLGGRELRAVDGITLPSGRRYVATGGEDTVVRIHALRDDDTPRCVVVLRKHTSGLQQVRWFVRPDGGVFLLSSSGHEELFIWRVQPLDDDKDDNTGLELGVVLEAALDDRTRDGDLRITSFAVRPNHAGKGLRISVAFSNSVLKTYAYDEGRFELLLEGCYTGACLTQIVHLDDGDDDYDSGILTAATDGFLALWTARDGAYVLDRRIRVHGGSIKALGLIPHTGSRRSPTVVTGGDDNALAVTELDEGRGKVVVVRDAHAASVNGVVVLADGRVASCSNDQRVKLWRWMGTRGVVLDGEAGSGVADAGDICALGGVVVVAGVGMEMLAVVG